MLRNAAPLICSEALSLTETKWKSQSNPCPSPCCLQTSASLGTGKGAETQRENLEGEGKGPRTPGFYALTFVNLPSNTFVLAFTVLNMLTGTMHPQVLLPWRPPPCTPAQAAYPGTLVAMLKAVSPRKTMPPQNQWNVMFKSNSKACVY